LLHILKDIPVTITAGEAVKQLKVAEDEDVRLVTDLFETAKGHAKPKAMYREVFVEDISGENVRIDGYDFNSGVLAMNMKNVHRVFAYVCTCGVEVDEWSKSVYDYMTMLWVDLIKQMFLTEANVFLRDHIKEVFKFEKLSAINPGSGNVENWPISQQTTLFEMIGGVRDGIGVKLTDSFLMVPLKSTSGLLFPSETNFVNCALCSRKHCVGRRAAFDDGLYRKAFKEGVGL